MTCSVAKVSEGCTAAAVPWRGVVSSGSSSTSEPSPPSDRSEARASSCAEATLATSSQQLPHRLSHLPEGPSGGGRVV